MSFFNCLPWPTPQVKYSNFRFYCLQICITDLKSQTEALLFPSENVFCCNLYFSRTCNGYVTRCSVAACDIVRGDRNSISGRSEFVLVTLKTQCNSVTQAVFPWLSWWWFCVPRLLQLHIGYFGVPLTLCQSIQKKKQTEKQVLVLHCIEMEFLVLHLQSHLQLPSQPCHTWVL